ncbi:MAG: hypothetical protein WCC46_12425 [Terriglobales bacterium]
MKIGRLLTCYFVLTVALLAASALAQSEGQTTPTLKFANVTVKGAAEVDTYAVNNAGVIAGDYIESSAVQHGVIINGKTVTTFDGPSGSTLISAYGINNSNAVVGWYEDGSGIPTGFMYAGGKFAPVAYPKAIATEANGINDNGWIVGSYFDAKSVEHGFYWDTKKYHAINVKGAFATVAWAINNSNVITVYTLTSKGAAQDSYLMTGTKLTKANVPGATAATVHGIDTAGDLDYTIFDASGNRHGVLYLASTKTYTQFDDTKGVIGTRADGINDKLEMVGRYTPPGDTTNLGFKATTKE